MIPIGAGRNNGRSIRACTHLYKATPCLGGFLITLTIRELSLSTSETMCSQESMDSLICVLNAYEQLTKVVISFLYYIGMGTSL